MATVMLSIPVPEEDAAWLLDQIRVLLAGRVEDRVTAALVAANPGYVEDAVAAVLIPLTAEAVIGAVADALNP